MLDKVRLPAVAQERLAAIEAALDVRKTFSNIDPESVARICEGRSGDPFSILGPHCSEHGIEIRTFQPGALGVDVVAQDQVTVLCRMRQWATSGFFAGAMPAMADRNAYGLRITWPGPAEANTKTVEQCIEDPYSFGVLLDESELLAFRDGSHLRLASCLGAAPMQLNGTPGVRFAVWAPNASRVSVVGDFNCWDGRRHPMRLRHEYGVWELFLPRLSAGVRYQFEILDKHGKLLPLKADPVARASSGGNGAASVVCENSEFRWHDQTWMQRRADSAHARRPISVYEVHPGSWKQLQGAHGGADWNALTEALVPYVKQMGFSHIELMPIMEHPYGGSWGYQPLGLFAPSTRYGSPQDFAAFVDRCHQEEIGVILDWVPAHFPTDAHGMARFDGTALYEHEDAREGYHQDWHTLIYNLGRNEVQSFLLSSALEWLERFHVDGLRVDAVSSMLYRDYSRKAGEWLPNIHGGRENLEAIAFLRRLNQAVAAHCPGALVIAEESTAWGGVTAAQEHGGLGFSYKWNMGWMHDSLHYMQRDALYRGYHHGELSFSLHYAFDERFMLPISHDEVVHGKGSLLEKMPGDAWQKLANLRAYLGFMWTHPGKKLLFMGCEFAQRQEWQHDGFLQWHLLEDARHRGVQDLVRDLNRLYRDMPQLHEGDCLHEGFEWLIGDDAGNSVYAYLRHGLDGDDGPLLVVCNFTPVPRGGYRIGVPAGERWIEVLNTDAAAYGGGNMGNLGAVEVECVPAHGQAASIVLTLPPLSTLVLRRED